MNYESASRTHWTLVLTLTLLLGLGLALVAIAAQPAHAAGIVVSTTPSANETCFVEASGDNTTDHSSADASAIQTAVNLASPGDLLKVAGYCAGVQETGGMTQTVYITQNLTLQGGYTTTNWLAEPDLATQPTTLDALRDGRVVYITGPAQVNLNYLIITKGKTPDQVAGGHGGGIHSTGVLTISHSTVISNATGYEAGMYGNGGSGAGIYSIGALNLYSTTVTSNTAGHGSTGGLGGGIYVSGTLALEHCTVSLNHSGDGASGTLGGHGGGIYAKGVAAIHYSTIVSNTTGGPKTIGDVGDGAGIYNLGWLTITHSTVSGNATGQCGVTCFGDGGSGGGLYSDGGTVLVEDSTVNLNSAGGYGGGVMTTKGAKMAATNLTVTGNQAGRDGGGIMLHDSGHMSATNLTIADNTAEVRGGGIMLWSSGYLTGTNLTISGNRVTTSTLSAGPGGGAIAASGDGGAVLAYTTIASNTAPNLAGRDGISLTASAAGVTLTASLIADNGTENCAYPGALIQDDGYNLDSQDSCGLVQTTSLTNTTPVLGSLADNSGPVLPVGAVMQTHALLAGSPAMDAIPAGSSSCGTLVAADQRGFSRPQGTSCDMGAFETRSLTLTVTLAGAGSGGVSGPGIDCANGGGGDCAESYLEQTAIALTATISPGSTFTGWGGACSGTGNCQVTMDAGKVVTATFGLEDTGYQVYLPYITRLSP